MLGTEYPDAMTARVGVATWTGKAGHAAAARDQFAALVPIMEKVLGTEHHDTLAARSKLAYWAEETGRQAD